MSTALQRARLDRELATLAAWMVDFDLDAARSGAAHRIARLALLDLRARKTFERTDAAVEKVEAALAEVRAGLSAARRERPARNKTARLPLAICDL